MGDFWNDVEEMVNESRIKVPYAWQAGETASRFLISLRDDKQILGRYCPKCKKVLVPPRKGCPFCFVDTTDWIKVADEGVVEAFSVVNRATPIQPLDAPFAYAVIRLDGADTGLVHMLGEIEPDVVREGMRVKAVFAEERTASLLDILYFKSITS